LSPTEGSEIELIGPLRQLSHAGQLLRGERLDVNLQFQARKKIFQVDGLRAKVFALLVLPVHVGAAPVLSGQLKLIERPAMVQKLRNELGILRQLQGQDLRAFGLDRHAFYRVVIEKDETV